MTDWQLTTTTVYCDAVDDEVTLLVHRDWSVECTGCTKYAEPDKDALNLLKKKSKQLKRQLGCTGLGCHRVIQYKGKLLSEEAKKECPG